MWLKELTGEFVSAFRSKSDINKKTWADENIDRLNSQSVRALAVTGLMSELSSKIRSIKMEINSIVSGQTELPFDLPFAVSIDPSDTRVKATSELTREDMAIAIALRTKHVRDAQLKLSEFVAANRAAEPFWDIHPDWTFGQCISAYMQPREDADIRKAA